MNEAIFIIGLTFHGFLLLMLVMSSKNEHFQFWPPPKKNSWQYHSLWWSIRFLVMCIGWLSYNDFSSIFVPYWIRFYIAFPLCLATFFLGSIAGLQLGWRNTHGEADCFVDTGFYKYSRNPQYVLFAVCFIFLGIWVASAKALGLLALLSFWYLRAPFPEEKWLEQHYGEIYLDYKEKVPRYFGWSKNA